MPAVRPFSRDLRDTHCQVALALGDVLCLKAAVSTASATVNLAEANGVSYAGATTSGTTRLDVGPFAAAVVLNVMATGEVRAETSVSGCSVAAT